MPTANGMTDLPTNNYQSIFKTNRMKQKISDMKKAGKEKQQENPVTVETRQENPGIIRHISLSEIVCSPFNPRKYRPEEDLLELKTSIANFGIIQPVTLRSKGETYEIVCGERRYRI
jgi:hypothetical protein